jgi:hypothetical protein
MQGRKEKVNWTDCVMKEVLVPRAKKDMSTQHAVRKRKAKYICHILGRNCFLKRVTEGKIEELRRRGR